MTTETVDIIVPVWNRPVETRACLVSLIENSSDIRLILVDNSCERETEVMLGEFAEALDVRALFLKNRLNEGFVKGVNRGLSRAESQYVAIVRQSSVVRPGWLLGLRTFMAETPDAGIVVPGYCDKEAKKGVGKGSCRGMEVPYADFAGFLMRRSLLDTVGNFNEEMDGGFWCLKEYTRRALRGGYRTCTVPESLVEKSEELNLGSSVRRAEHEQLLRTEFKDAWGEELFFCIHLPKGSDLSTVIERFKLIAVAARQGNRIMVLAHPTIGAELIRAGYNRIHELISIASLSRFMPERSIRNAITSLSACDVPLTHVSWEDGAPFSGTFATIRFSDFANIVTEYERMYYGRTTVSLYSGGPHEE